MISKAIYFIDRWITNNIPWGDHDRTEDAEGLAKQCVDDAAKAGISGAELEESLGTDLIDFLSHELTSRTKPDCPVDTRSD